MLLISEDTPPTKSSKGAVCHRFQVSETAGTLSITLLGLPEFTSGRLTVELLATDSEGRRHDELPQWPSFSGTSTPAKRVLLQKAGEIFAFAATDFAELDINALECRVSGQPQHIQRLRSAGTLLTVTVGDRETGLRVATTRKLVPND